MKHIVLPTDFSKNAWNAMSYAAKLLKNTSCIFYLMHAYTPPIYRIDYTLYDPSHIGLPDDYQYSTETALEKIRKEIRKEFHNPRHTFMIHAAFNTLEDEIRTVVKNKDIDLIIMGTQGATGTQEVLFGSNTVHVLQKASVPVLAIPSEFKGNPPKRILFPTDFEINYVKANLNFLLWLSELWHSKIKIIHVSALGELTSAQQSNKAHLKRMMSDHVYEMHIVPNQELIGTINKFQEKTLVDLLVMVRNKHTFLERLFMKSVIKNIGLHCKVPFLVLPYSGKP